MHWYRSFFFLQFQLNNIVEEYKFAHIHNIATSNKVTKQNDHRREDFKNTQKKKLNLNKLSSINPDVCYIYVVS